MPVFTVEEIDKLRDSITSSLLAGINAKQILWVDSVNGSNNNDGLSRGSPKATLAGALAVTTTAIGAVINVAPGHTETLASANPNLTHSLSGVTVIGHGKGRNRPAFTQAAIDNASYLLSGNNNHLKNLRFIGASTTATSTGSVLLSITGTDNIIEDCVFEHATTLGCILLAAAHRTKIINPWFIGTAAGPDFCIKTTGTAAPSIGVIIRGLRSDYSQSSGLDSGVIICHNTTGIPGWDMDDIRAVAIDGAVLDINGSSIGTTVDSLATNCYGAFLTATSAAAAYDIGSTFVANSFWTDAVAAPSPWLGVAFNMSASPTSLKGVVAGTSVGTAAQPT